MLMRQLFIYFFAVSISTLLWSPKAHAQIGPPTMEEIAKRWGPNDTIIVGGYIYDNDILPYAESETVWVSKMNERQLQKYIAEWTRLRNAVYVTYPYARIAGATINDINRQLAGISNKSKRKEIIKSREKELKKQFADPLSNLSVYQGKILMKLINRETGNNCYEIIKEFKGGLNARFYQTVAFFVGGNLKQDWDLKQTMDRQIEGIVEELNSLWYPFQNFSGNSAQKKQQ